MIPEDKKAEIPKNLSYHDLPDGIYYFKLNSKVGPSVWKEAGVFRTQIDTIPPESFRPLIASSPAVFGGRAFVSFSTVDKTSGISHYKVKVGLFRDSIETKSPDRKSTRLNSSHQIISYAVFCLKKKKE